MKKYGDIRVLLIDGSSRQVLPVMKSLYKLGCKITTYNSSRFDMGYSSRYPDKRIIAFCSPSDPERTFDAIRKVIINGRYDVVIPLNDFIAKLLSENKKDLSKYTFIATNDWDVFQIASDKLKTMQICMENKIPCPLTLLDYSNFDTYNLDFPLVIKPRMGYGAVGFRIVHNRQELQTIYNATQKKFGPTLIQEFIPQTDLQYKAELFVDRSGIVKSAVVFAKVRWYPLDGGSSTLNVTVERPDIIENCTKLLKSINWHGYADIDLIQDPRDNIAKIMEINPRITGSIKICYAAGVDFSEQIIQDALGIPVSEYLDYEKGVYLRYIHTDILWFLKSKDRFNTNPSWFSFRKSLDQIFDLSDPIPFITYTIQSVSKLIRDKKKRALDR